ncbi:MAG: nuclear transport factor 2 family protein [Chloroflexi bacterium]|nr:nuclear transport factor 2 family protein [Chloroflexota bacterium]
MVHTEQNPTAPKTLPQRWIEAFNKHDVSVLVALYAEDAELFDSGMKRARHGREEIEQWFMRRFQMVPTISYIPKGYLLGEEQAFVEWITTGTIRLLGQRGSSRLLQVEGVSVFTIRNGLIQKQRGYYDHLSVLEQLLPLLKWLLPVRL